MLLCFASVIVVVWLALIIISAWIHCTAYLVIYFYRFLIVWAVKDGTRNSHNTITWPVCAHGLTQLFSRLRKWASTYNSGNCHVSGPIKHLIHTCTFIPNFAAWFKIFCSVDCMHPLYPLSLLHKSFFFSWFQFGSWELPLFFVVAIILDGCIAKGAGHIQFFRRATIRQKTNGRPKESRNPEKIWINEFIKRTTICSTISMWWCIINEKATPYSPMGLTTHTCTQTHNKGKNIRKTTTCEITA